MASIKVKFQPSSIAGHEGTVYYQITHDKKQRRLLSGYHLLPSEWDECNAIVINSVDCNRESLTLSIREHIRRDMERFSKIIHRFNKKEMAYTADDVINEFKRYNSEYSLFNFMKGIIIKLRQNGNVRTSETYATTLNSFRKFLTSHALENGFMQYEDITLDSINSDVMRAYQAWHQRRGVVPNTISFYTRILRAVYNRAVEEDIIENRHPFRHVYTGIDKTEKRALSLSLIKRIKTLDLSRIPTLDFARDIFILSFMLRGMSFVDMAFLKKSDLADGRIIYRRRKTGQKLVIEWTKDMQVILDKYPENRTDYLLPIIRKNCVNERAVYRNVSYRINHSLKIIAKKLGLDIPLTLYVARHSWASIAKSKGIPLSVISEGMGHDNEMTTQIYLASLDSSVVDKANSVILDSLK